MSRKTQPDFPNSALAASKGENTESLQDLNAGKEQEERKQGFQRSRYFDIVSILLGSLTNIMIATTGFYVHIGNAIYKTFWLYLLLNILCYYFGTAAIVNHRRMGWIGFTLVLTSLSFSGMWNPFGLLLSLGIALVLWLFLREKPSS